MKSRKLIITGTGIFLMLLSIGLSFFPYNPGMFSSPIHYSYGCILDIDDFARSYSYSSDEQEDWWCQHNIMVSAMILAIGASGAILLVWAKP